MGLNGISRLTRKETVWKMMNVLGAQGKNGESPEGPVKTLIPELLPVLAIINLNTISKEASRYPPFLAKLIEMVIKESRFNHQFFKRLPLTFYVPLVSFLAIYNNRLRVLAALKILLLGLREGGRRESSAKGISEAISSSQDYPESITKQ
ncbi:hypothetical protein TNCV_3469911 [Trichonephila clavipes]|nr:hypothetical protein TNCV_3469911 [Trichonephila clavipes]